ncbi:MAG: N-acetylmuramoyl-L-alanine amidase, partial [Alphaproteobacteria bacterium]|nr:N-acetylmuramoyl-L-alanine amidase [Alphaproteobacteria bacterium]
AIQTFVDNNVSSHYVIGEDGTVWQLTGEKHRAWHAGKSFWRGVDDINSHGIGIELCTPTLGQTAFSDAQQRTLTALLQRLIKKYKIKPENIVGHSDIAPTRKPDPGKAFFWKALAEQGIGFWYDSHDADCLTEKNPEALLKIIGYDTADLQAALFAFCRRFVPEMIPTVKDLKALVETPVDYSLHLEHNAEALKILKAVAYKYLTASNTPCRM